MDTPEKSKATPPQRDELPLPSRIEPTAGDVAARWFEAGFNCAESAVLALLPDSDRAQSLLRAATGFGGGIARHGLTCGAISGAALAVGSVLGRTDAQDEAGKERAYRVIDAVIRRFEERYGTVQCHRLTGFDFLGPHDEQEFLTKVKPLVCVPLLRFAVEVAVEELRKAQDAAPGNPPGNDPGAAPDTAAGAAPAPPQAA